MSGTGKLRGRPRGSGGKGNGRVQSIPSSYELRNIAKYTTPPVSTPSPTSSNPIVPLSTLPIPSPTTER